MRLYEFIEDCFDLKVYRKLSVLTEQRIGDSERDSVINHLNQMHAEGRISAAILDKRLDYAMKAKNKHDLELAIEDLPSIQAQKNKALTIEYREYNELKERLTNQTCNLSFLSLVGILSSIGFAAIGTVLLVAWNAAGIGVTGLALVMFTACVVALNHSK